MMLAINKTTQHCKSCGQLLWTNRHEQMRPPRQTLTKRHGDSNSLTPRAQLGTRIPEWVYNTPLGPDQDKAEWDRYRPDVLIATEGAPSAGDRIQQFHKRSIHIVEVKYCRDTDRSSQCLRATQQHEALRDALLKVGYKPEQVHLHVITLGATGTIYQDIHETLTVLGLE